MAIRVPTLTSKVDSVQISYIVDRLKTVPPDHILKALQFPIKASLPV